MGTLVESDAAIDDAEELLDAILGMAIRVAAVMAVGAVFSMSFMVRTRDIVAKDPLID